MKLRDLDIAFKLKTQSPEFLAAQVVNILHHSLPDDYVDEESIANQIKAGVLPSEVVRTLTKETSGPQGSIQKRDHRLTEVEPAQRGPTQRRGECHV